MMLSEEEKKNIIAEEFRQDVRKNINRQDVRRSVSGHIKEVYFDDLIQPHIPELKKQVSETISRRPINFEDIKFYINRSELIAEVIRELDTKYLKDAIKEALVNEIIDTDGNVKKGIIEEGRRRIESMIDDGINSVLYHHFADR